LELPNHFRKIKINGKGTCLLSALSVSLGYITHKVNKDFLISIDNEFESINGDKDEYSMDELDYFTSRFFGIRKKCIIIALKIFESKIIIINPNAINCDLSCVIMNPDLDYEKLDNYKKLSMNNKLNSDSICYKEKEIDEVNECMDEQHYITTEEEHTSQHAIIESSFCHSCKEPEIICKCK